ncbi:MAG: LytR C-terminal domain-containing protein [Nocardioidaceae bacterium]
MKRNDMGYVMSSRLLAFTVSLLALAALLFIAQRPDSPVEKATTARAVVPSPSASSDASAEPVIPKVRRGQTLVEIFNNSRVKGLAAATARKAEMAGWNVVGTDNWYGTVASTAVYFPPGMHAAAQALAADLGIKKVKPAVAPMRLDRLTVVLTADYH